MAINSSSQQMNKNLIIFIISFISALAITSLLYSAGLGSELIYQLFFSTLVINYIVFWLTLEFIFLRDGFKLKDILTLMLKGIKTDELPQSNLSLALTKNIDKKIRILQKRKEQEILKLLERANFRSQFVADISHELKTPIFAAQGYVYTLLDGAMDDEDVREKFLKKSAKSLDYLDKLVHDLLELSHIETGNMVLMPEHFDVAQLVEEVIEDLEPLALKSKISISKSNNYQEAIVYADFTRIRQVLHNLVSNAIKYNIIGGKVKIEIIDHVKSIELRVEDTGSGIPQEDISKIFNRFYRVDKSRTKIKNQASNGLGLSIVKHLLESHHSSIQVESKVGKGSIFRFSLQKDKPTKIGQRAKNKELDSI